MTAGSAGVAARADEWPFRGTVKGELRIEQLAALGLKWEVESSASGIVARATRPGVEIELVVTSGEGGGWTWAVRRGVVDLGEAWPLLRDYVGEDAKGWSASGRVEIAGEGRWFWDGMPEGEVRVTLREGWARSEELDMEMSGIELDATTRDFSGGTLGAGQTLRVAKISKAGAEVTDTKLVFGMNAAQVVEVSAGEALFLGGRVRLRPFTLPLAAPAVTAAADIEALQLGEVARLMPWVLDMARGKLRGRVELAWDAVKGLRVRDGGLDIVKSDDAAFRLTSSPGLLTGDMPARFTLLPWNWARWMTMNNPAYAPIKQIELGREGLVIETFRVTFWPDGPGTGRTATIHIVGKPSDGKLVDEVKMDLNFHGPWSEFMAFGLNNELSDLKLRFE